jgi:hypothetical protein
MEWVIACDQPFEEVERPEFVAMMKYTHHTGTSLKIPKRDGIKRRLMNRSADRIPYEPYVRYHHMGAVYRPGGHLEL